MERNSPQPNPINNNIQTIPQEDKESATQPSPDTSTQTSQKTSSHRLVMLQRDEKMYLSHEIDGGKTNQYYLMFEYEKYLRTKKTYSRNTRLMYLHYAKSLFPKNYFQKGLDVPQFLPTLTCQTIEKYLSLKNINARAGVKMFLKFIEVTFNLKFERLEFPDIVKSDQKIIEVLSDKEVERIGMILEDKFPFHTRFIYITGCRISEIFRPQMNSINWEEASEDKRQYGLLRITNTKGKRDRQVPLKPSFLSEIMQNLKQNLKRKYYFLREKEGKKKHLLIAEREFLEERSDFIPVETDYILDFNQDRALKKRRDGIIKKDKLLGIDTLGKGLDMNERQQHEYEQEVLWEGFIKNKSFQYQQAFRDASKEVVGHDCHPHILRKSRATKMLNDGIPLLDVMNFLGHADIRTTQIYLNFDVRRLTDKMKELDL